METVNDSDIRKNLTLDGDGFNVNIDGKFNIYIKRENVGYVLDVWVGDTLVNTMALWDDCINNIMEEEKDE